MPSTSSDRDLVEVLAEDFVERHRRGERPALSEYTDRHPDRAAEIRDLFPALVVMEQLKPAGDHTAGFDGATEVTAERPPDRLGDYRILREVGRGGMGVVYEAEQVSLSRHVALKVLPAHGLLNPTFLERFRREAKAVAKLHHTNIVPVFGVGEADGVHFYAMQFIRGEGLDKVLHDVRRLRQQHGAAGPEFASTLGASIAHSLIAGQFEESSGARQPPVDSQKTGADAPHSPTSSSLSKNDYYRGIARLGLQAAEALAYAHKQGVLHRDVKPSNLLLDFENTLWITDFGLAKAEGTDELTHDGDIVGTIRFMAPERFDGHSSPQSDIYSLGVTLYEMVALRPAFDAANRAKLIEQVLHDLPARPSRFDRHLPRDLETIILKCLAKDQRERYASAEALADDLGRFLADRPIKARRATWPEQLVRWRRRNPALAGAAAAVFLLLVAIAVGSTVATLWLRSALQTSEKNRGLADEARRNTEVQRWEARFEQAKANRLSRRPGQRIKTLEILRRCATEAEALKLPAERRAELRNAVIATLAMPDLYLTDVTAFAPDHRAEFDGNLEQVALVDAKGNCVIRRVADDAELFRIPGGGVVISPTFSHSGEYLSLLGDDGRLRLWQRRDSDWQLRLTVANVKKVHFHSNDGLIAHCHPDGSLSVYELPAVELKYHLAPATIGDGLNVDFHPTEPIVVCASYFSAVAQIRDVRNGNVLAKLDGLRRPCSPVWHPDGRNLIISEGEGGKIHHCVWDPAAKTLTRRRTFVTETGGPVVAFNRTGDRFAVLGWNGIAYLFDFETGQMLFQSPSAWRYSAPRFDATGTRLAGAVMRQGGKLGIWHVGDGRDYRTLVHDPLAEPDGFTEAAVHPDGRLLAAGVENHGVGLWDVPTGRLLARLPFAGVKSVHVAFDQAGVLYTTCWAGTFRWPVRPASDSADALAVGPPELLPFGRGHSELAVSPDGRIRAKGYGYGYGEAPNAGAWVQFADRLGPPTRLEAVTSGSSTSISPDGRWIAAGQHNSNILIWEVTDGTALTHVKSLEGVGPFCRFSPNGRWLWAALDGGRLFHTQTWEPGPACEGTSCAFSPHDDLLATTVTAGYVTLFDARTGGELARLEDPNLDFSYPPTFNQDGSQLITVTIGNVKGLHVWDLRRIRRTLKEMDLDWDAPDFPPEPVIRPLARAAFVQPDLAALPPDWNPIAPQLDRDRWQGQVALFSLALVFQPVNPEAHFRRGYAYYKLKLNQDAVADFSRALALRPRHTNTLHFRAHALEQLGRWERAEADFTAALARKPDDAHFLDRRGRCRLHLDHFDNGIVDLERSVAVKPDQPELKKFLGIQCNNRAWKLLIGPEKERNPSRAYQLSETAVRFNPEQHLFVNTLGVAQYRLGRHREAVATLERSLALGKETFVAFDLYFLAMCHAKLGDAANAKACFDRAVKWHDEQRDTLSATYQRELAQFRAEAENLVTPMR